MAYNENIFAERRGILVYQLTIRKVRRSSSPIAAGDCDDIRVPGWQSKFRPDIGGCAINKLFFFFNAESLTAIAFGTLSDILSGTEPTNPTEK